MGVSKLMQLLFGASRHPVIPQLLLPEAPVFSRERCHSFERLAR